MDTKLKWSNIKPRQSFHLGSIPIGHINVVPVWICRLVLAKWAGQYELGWIEIRGHKKQNVSSWRLTTIWPHLRGNQCPGTYSKPHERVGGRGHTRGLGSVRSAGHTQVGSWRCVGGWLGLLGRVGLAGRGPPVYHEKSLKERNCKCTPHKLWKGVKLCKALPKTLIKKSTNKSHKPPQHNLTAMPESVCWRQAVKWVPWTCAHLRLLCALLLTGIDN